MEHGDAMQFEREEWATKEAEMAARDEAKANGSYKYRKLDPEGKVIEISSDSVAPPQDTPIAVAPSGTMKREIDLEGAIQCVCKDCKVEFWFEKGEAEFYRARGWDDVPVRCKTCRVAKKERISKKGCSIISDYYHIWTYVL